MINVESLCPLRASSLPWRSAQNPWCLTVIVKGTYLLTPVAMQLADHQEEVREADNFWNDDSSHSVHTPSDFAPFKARADVVLVGQAFAPRGEPVRSLVTRLSLGAVDKSIEVVNERSWSSTSELVEGSAFASMPLLYERAAGGPRTWNPVGVGEEAVDLYDRPRLPNLFPVGYVPQSPYDIIPTVGYGPVAATWPSRVERLGRHAGTWSKMDGFDGIPMDIDPAFFNVAPPGQQLLLIRGDEELALENLLAEHPQLVTRLPGMHPRVFVQQPSGPIDLPTQCDTIWIDTNRSICTLTWRVRVAIQHPDQVPPIYVLQDHQDQKATWADVEACLAKQRRATPSVHPPSLAPKKRPRTADMPTFPGALDRRVLPYQGSGTDGVERRVKTPAAQANAPKITRREELTITGQVSLVPQGPNWLRSAGLDRPLPNGSAPLAGSASPILESPWLATARETGSPIPPLPLFPLPPAELGAAAASDAAATAGESTNRASGAHPIVPSSRPAPNEAVDLLWFDAKAVKRIKLWWKEAATELEFVEVDPRHELPTDDPEVNRNRQLVSWVLTQTQSEDAGSLPLLVQEAVSEHGRFTPPLVVLHGVLRFPFDEMETARATIGAMTPFAGSDNKLKELIDVVNTLLATPYVQGAGVAQRLTQQLREQFTQSVRGVALANIEGHVERVLLEQRHYDMRKVFGEPRIRALLTNGNGTQVPVYLPNALASELPMMTSLRVRLIAEVLPAQDQYEACAYALRPCGLGRVIELENRPSQVSLGRLRS